MEQMRKPFQGVWNVVRFNWHFYLLSGIGLLLVFLLSNFLNAPFRLFSRILFFLAVAVTSISLIVTYYVYDLSSLYELSWLKDLRRKENSKIVNINAGFDETSALLQTRYKDAELEVFDFYNPLKHTEISIKRARKAYPPFPNTKQISTNVIPLEDNSVDKIFAVLSAHEIRDKNERSNFFQELHRILKPKGQIIVTEHLRDTANFLAYSIGFFHFHSKRAWLETFQKAGLKIEREIKITPFISTFILEKL
ncbi:MAG: class I SAM-dependent methyltransferase [Pyrinomonadaceae bacterium]